MNIGIFTDTYFPIINGVSTSVMMLDKELTKLGHTVYIFTTSAPKAEKNPHVFRLPSMPFVFMPTNRMALMYPPRLLLRMKKFKLDIIHTQTEFPLGIFGKLVSEVYKIPLVHTYHTMYEDYVHYIAKGYVISQKMAQKYSRIFCNRALAVIAPVNKTKEKLLTYGVVRPIHVIPTGIDFQPFSPDNFSKAEINGVKAELGIDINDPVMISVGRVAKEKSIDVLIKQMPRVLEKIPNLKFVIVGDGGVKKDLQTLAKSLGVSDSVIFAGAKPWSMIGKYYQLGDVFACASTSETQGLTYIEAMAAKIPVIAKRDKSVEGVINHGVTGYYFDNDDDAAGVICDALGDREKLETIAQTAYESVQVFSSANFGANLEALYIEVLALASQINEEKKQIKHEKKNKLKKNKSEARKIFPLFKAFDKQKIKRETKNK